MSKASEYNKIECQHIIGIIYSNDSCEMVTLQDIISNHERETRCYNELQKFDLEVWEKEIYYPIYERRIKRLEPLLLLDKYKGSMNHFDYCPLCGNKNDFKKMREQTRRTYE